MRTETSAGIEGNSFVFSTVPGETYSFSIAANNVCGTSGQTQALAIIAGYAPGVPTLVRTQVDAAEEYAICGWSASIANGFPITGYRVAIRTQEAEINVLDTFAREDVYTNVAPYCTENISVVNSVSNFATMVQDVRCTMPISQLRLSPYSLVQKQSIACRVIAVNQRGESAAGYGEGAFMPRIRSVPGAPIGVETRLMSDLRRVSVHWQAPEDNGGWEITGYQVSIRISMSGRDNYRVATGHCAETQNIRNGQRLDDHDDVWIQSQPCTLTVELLKSEEYNLFDGASVWAYVQAKNRLGHSAVSAIGNGAILPSRPDAPFAPTLVDRTIETI